MKRSYPRCDFHRAAGKKKRKKLRFQKPGRHGILVCIERAQVKEQTIFLASRKHKKNALESAENR